MVELGFEPWVNYDLQIQGVLLSKVPSCDSLKSSQVCCDRPIPEWYEVLPQLTLSSEPLKILAKTLWDFTAA